ncbi:MAG TPA: DUF4861 domain-containing protein, partial [Armatimonadetes bacterium]|nr:DUF4861 domain-containing protein [Armatimonadota bacterium]
MHPLDQAGREGEKVVGSAGRMGVLALFLLLSLCLGAQQRFSFFDDFSRYPEGSQGRPNWEPLSFGWEVKGGKYVNDEPLGKVFALVKRVPHVRRLVIEATLRIHGLAREKPWRGWWKVAGVVVYKDRRNLWHLALVEAPREQGGKHSFELQELYEGTWLAQNKEPTRLSQTVAFDAGIPWEYGRPYRLRLSLSPEGILGEIFGPDGKLLFKRGYRFDNPKAVTFGRPGLDNGGFLAEFDDVRVEASSPVKYWPQRRRMAVRPRYARRNFPKVKGERTGFFHVERIGDKWWVIDPNGNGFFAIGTDHVRFTGHWCEKLGYSPYHRNNLEKYGTEERWAEATVRRLLRWGFNLLSAGHSESLRYRGLAHTIFLGFGSTFSDYDDIVPKVHWTGFPNVFNPKFERFCDIRARELCLPARDDPWLFGYFLDNELEWFGKTHKPWGIFTEAVKKPKDHSAKRALVDMLKGRYLTIEALNSAWGKDFRSFDEMLERVDWQEPENETMKKDAMDFVALVAERYFSITTAAIRRYDENHMILGCRFAGYAPEPVWKVAGKYCDIVTLNFYGRVDLDTGEPVGLVEHLTKCYELCKRPLMITEWSFPALDSGLPCKHGAGMRVDTQEQKAFCFTVYQTTFFSLPFVVGSDYFMWVDEPALGISRTFPEDSNYGLVNERDEPYEEFVKVVERVNRQVYEIRMRGWRPRRRPRPEPAPWPAPPKGGKWLLRTPVVLDNPRGVPVSNPYVSLPLSRLLSELNWAGLKPSQIIALDAKGEKVKMQFDDLDFDGKPSGPDEICLQVPLGPKESKTVYIYVASVPVREERGCVEGVYISTSPGALEITNGPLRLVKRRESGDALDEFSLRRTRLGRLFPLIQQVYEGRSRWPSTDTTERMAVSKGPLRVILSLLLSLKKPEAKRPLPAEAGLPYRTLWRVAVYPGRHWVSVRVLRVENISNTEWTLPRYFVFCYPEIGGSTEGDEVGGPGVPNYYLNFGAWFDPNVKAFYGATARWDGFR